MNTTGYLHHWIRNKYRIVWPGRSEAPRLMGRNAVVAEQQNEFLALGKALVARLEEVIPDEHRLPIEFEIVDLDFVGAWVVWPAKCSGVLLTKELVRQIQRSGWVAKDLLPLGMKASVKIRNFLADLWADLPQDEAYFYHFGSLISHVAFSFIVHHELAHAGLGHEGLHSLRRSQAGISSAMATLDAEADFMDEFAGVVSQGTGKGAALDSQSLETDADVHGMFYTRRLLKDMAQALRGTPPGAGDVGQAVWRTLLRDESCVQLILFMGVAIGLLVLLPDLEAERVEGRSDRTHPPVPSRLLLALHAAGSLSGYSDSYWENRSAAVTTAISVLGVLYLEETGIDVLERRGQEEAADEDDALLDANERGRRKWATLSHLSIVDAFLRTRELGPQWAELVANLRTLAPALVPYARFPDTLRFGWYSAASKEVVERYAREAEAAAQHRPGEEGAPSR